MVEQYFSKLVDVCVGLTDANWREDIWKRFTHGHSSGVLKRRDTLHDSSQKERFALGSLVGLGLRKDNTGCRWVRKTMEYEREISEYITNSTPQQASQDKIYKKVPDFLTQPCFHNLQSEGKESNS